MDVDVSMSSFTPNERFPAITVSAPGEGAELAPLTSGEDSPRPLLYVSPPSFRHVQGETGGGSPDNVTELLPNSVNQAMLVSSSHRRLSLYEVKSTLSTVNQAIDRGDIRSQCASQQPSLFHASTAIPTFLAEAQLGRASRYLPMMRHLWYPIVLGAGFIITVLTLAFAAKAMPLCQIQPYAVVICVAGFVIVVAWLLISFQILLRQLLQTLMTTLCTPGVSATSKDPLLREFQLVIEQWQQTVNSPQAGSFRGGCHVEFYPAMQEEVTRLKNASQGYLITSQSGTILWVNPAMLYRLGYTEYDMLGENITMLMPVPYAKVHSQFISQCIVVQHAGPKERGNFRKERDVALLTSQGKLVVASLVLEARPALPNPELNLDQDQVVFWCQLTFLEEDKEIEGLEDSLLSQPSVGIEKVCEKWLNFETRGVMVTDVWGNILFVNPELCKQLQYATSAELVGKNVSILMVEPLRSLHAGFIQKYIERCQVNGDGSMTSLDAAGVDCLSMMSSPHVISSQVVGAGRDLTVATKGNQQVRIFLTLYRVDRCSGHVTDCHMVAFVRVLENKHCLWKQKSYNSIVAIPKLAVDDCSSDSGSRRRGTAGSKGHLTNTLSVTPSKASSRCPSVAQGSAKAFSPLNFTGGGGAGGGGFTSATATVTTLTSPLQGKVGFLTPLSPMRRSVGGYTPTSPSFDLSSFGWKLKPYTVMVLHVQLLTVALLSEEPALTSLLLQSAPSRRRSALSSDGVTATVIANDSCAGTPAGNLLAMYSEILKVIQHSVDAGRGHLSSIVGDTVVASFNLTPSNPTHRHAACDTQAAVKAGLQELQECQGVDLSRLRVVSAAATGAAYYSVDCPWEVQFGSCVNAAFAMVQAGLESSVSWLIDDVLYHTVEHSYLCRPVNVVVYPNIAAKQPRYRLCHEVCARKEMGNDEWMYGIAMTEKEDPYKSWRAMFQILLKHVDRILTQLNPTPTVTDDGITPRSTSTGSSPTLPRRWDASRTPRPPLHSLCAYRAFTCLFTEIGDRAHLTRLVQSDTGIVAVLDASSHLVTHLHDHPADELAMWFKKILRGGGTRTFSQSTRVETTDVEEPFFRVSTPPLPFKVTSTELSTSILPESPTALSQPLESTLGSIIKDPTSPL